MSALKPVKVGLIGCGMIANNAYMPTITKQYSMLDVVKCADTVPERAELFAKKYGMEAVSNEDIYNDPEIEIVLNLTYPNSHYEVTKAALEHGKNVHCEKMMAVTWEEAQELVALAEKQGVWFTMAPDTFLGGAWQTARKLIDDGYIGEPISARCVMGRGAMKLGGPRYPSTRRPLPQQEGASPFPGMPAGFMRERLPGNNPRSPIGSGLPYDMGGYYLHNLINLFGNINRVAGFISKHRPMNASYDPLSVGYKEPEIEGDHENLVGSLEFSNGTFATITFPGGVARVTEQFVVYGTEATLVLPDPNFFGGKVRIIGGGRSFNFNDPDMGTPKIPDMNDIPFTHGYLTESRGVGLMDVAFAIRNGRKPRCHYSMGYQAFEVVKGLIDCTENSVMHTMVSHCDRPAAVKPGTKMGDAQQFFFDD